MLRFILVFCFICPKLCFFFHIFESGLSLGVVHTVQSDLHAQPEGETVLHADVGFLPDLPQLPGVFEVTVEVYLQELHPAKNEDHGICTFL